MRGIRVSPRLLQNSGVRGHPEFHPGQPGPGASRRSRHAWGWGDGGDGSQGGGCGQWPARSVVEPDPRVCLSLSPPSVCPRRAPSPGIWDKKDFVPRPAPSSRESQGVAQPAPGPRFRWKVRASKNTPPTPSLAEKTKQTHTHSHLHSLKGGHYTQPTLREWRVRLYLLEVKCLHTLFEILLKGNISIFQMFFLIQPLMCISIDSWICSLYFRLEYTPSLLIVLLKLFHFYQLGVPWAASYVF